MTPVKAYVHYPNGKIAPGVLLKRTAPISGEDWMQVPATLCCNPETQAFINGELKAFIKYDAKGKVVSGSTIVRSKTPKPQGKFTWVEIPYLQCCTYMVTADLTAYLAALAAAPQANYTPASWTIYQAVVTANVVTGANTQAEVDAATAAIVAAQANLVLFVPVNSTLPTITGTARVGQVLTSTNGTWTGKATITYTRQWRRGATNIAGATATTYTPVIADAGQTITVVVTATNSLGSNSATSAATAAVTQTPVNTAVPTITGTAQEGQVLTATNGTWTGTPTPTYTRQWQTSADGATGWTNISGATATTYTLITADVGNYLRVVVTGTNSAGNAAANSVATAQIIAA